MGAMGTAHFPARLVSVSPEGDAQVDTGLIEAARSGDQDAFHRLVEPYRRELHQHCYRILGSVADAEDAMQETLLAAWRGLARFEGRASIRLVCPRDAPRPPPPT